MRRGTKLAGCVAVACLALCGRLRGQSAPQELPALPGDSEMIRSLLGKLELTGEQGKQVQEILAKTREEVASQFDQNKAKMEELSRQMQAAQSAKDAAKIKDLCEQMVKLMPDTTKSFRDQVRVVLNEEQNKKLDLLIGYRKVGLGGSPSGMTDLALKNADKLGLTEAQKTRLDEALKVYRAAVKSAEEERAKAVKSATDKLAGEYEAVLSADQQVEARKLPAGGPRSVAAEARLEDRVRRALKELNATEAQQKQAEEILSSSADLSDGTGRKRDPSRRQVLEIRDLLPTGQQAKFDEVVSGRPAEAGDRPPAPAGEKKPAVPSMPGPATAPNEKVELPPI